MAQKSHDAHGTFWVVSLKVEKELEIRLKSLQLEGCRYTREIANYLLDVESAVLSENSAFRIRPKAENPSELTGYIKLHLSEEVYERLDSQAKAYGVWLTELCRVYLWIGIRHHIKLVPQGTMVQKEEFTRLVRRELEKQNQLDNIRHRLWLIWRALLGRG